MLEIPILLFVCWMLIYFFPKKKKKRTNVRLNIELNLVAFPDYPISPQLKLETIQEDYVLSRWQQKIAEWKEADAGKLWCVAMNNWFINHEFNSKEEIKRVVTHWLLKLEEVVGKGCLKIDEINVIVKAAEILLLLDNNNSLFQFDMLILMSVFTDSEPNRESKKKIEQFVGIKKAEKQKLLEPQRQVFETLKHNLEGIIEGNQNELLPIDSENCELAEYFHSVCDDVREIWNKLPNQSIEGTTEHVKGNKPEVNKLRDKVEKESPKVNKGRDKVERTETVVPESKKRGKVPIAEYNVLREHRVEMVNTLEPEKVIPYLIQHNVIDKDDVEMIEKKCKDLRRKGVETMLDILYKSGRWAFEKLIEALLNAGYQEMAETLREDFEKKKTVDPQSVSTTKQRGCLSTIEYEVLRDNHERLVDEVDSSVLKNHLFKYEVINEEDLENISKKEEERTKEGAEEMVNIIHKSGSNAFPKLIISLHEAGYDELSSKLDTDLKQKKNEKTYQRKKIELNLVAFPNYPRSMLEFDDNIHWIKNVKKWLNAVKGWCDAMNHWFNNHEFNSKEEVKVVVKDWLLKLEEVVGKGFIRIEVITSILNVAEILLNIDSNNSLLHSDYYKEMLLKVKRYIPIKESMEEIEEYVHILKAGKHILDDRQRQDFETLKHNLEGIIEGNQNELLPIDTEKCKQADLFPSVCDDVREIWNKLL